MYSSYNKQEVERYLTTCYQTSKQTALNTAADFYKKQVLQLLTLEDRKAELIRLDEIHQKEAEILNRPLYLSEADNPNFLLAYFTTGHHAFSINEEKNFRQAMILYEMNQTNLLLRAETEVEIEKKEIGDRCSKARSRGEKPDKYDLERMNFLLAHGSCEQRGINTSGVVRRPEKKYSFGYFGKEELLPCIVDGLTVEIGFLRLPTTTAQFVEVVTARDLSIVRIPVYMGCQNTQLIYVMEYFNGLFSSFTPATIGHSGLFYSRNGNLFTAHNLNCTSFKHVQKRYAIDALFKKYGIVNPRQ